MTKHISMILEGKMKLTTPLMHDILNEMDSQDLRNYGKSILSKVRDIQCTDEIRSVMASYHMAHQVARMMLSSMTIQSHLTEDDVSISIEDVKSEHKMLCVSISKFTKEGHGTTIFDGSVKCTPSGIYHTFELIPDQVT